MNDMKAFLLLLLLSLSLPGQTQNLERGKEINGTCAGCHGEFGQGGKKGEYPRLAGQRVAHLVEQLQAFRSRVRMNLAMYPYTQERELSQADIQDVSAYLAGIELPTQWPEFKPDDDALTRLTAMEKVMIIARTPGSLEAGGKIYQAECALCHAPDGLGKRKFPRLVGQYTSYLQKQMEAFVRGERSHDEDGKPGVLNQLKAQDLQDILAYLTSIQSVASK
jgi:cytochrome c553